MTGTNWIYCCWGSGERYSLMNEHILECSATACRCLAQEVWVQPLAGRFLRLVLQLLSRFSCWLSRGLDARAASPAAGNGEADASAGRWAIGIRPDQLCNLRADTEILLSWLESDYSTQLVNMLPSSSKEVRTTYLVACFSSAWPLYLDCSKV